MAQIDTQDVKGYEEDTESYAQRLSQEFLRDSRRYCRVLTTEVEEQ